MPSNTPSTQQLLEIKEIKDDIVYLKGTGMRAVIMVSGINFDLKSDEEQNTILYTFQNFLNALDFSMQFIVHSRKLTIDPYLKMLAEREVGEKNELLKTQISEYREFIRSFVEMNAIMSKAFYMVVPYDPPTLSATSSGGGGLASLLPFGGGTKKSTTQEGKKEDGSTAHRAQLEQRVDQVEGGIRRVGLRTARLNSEELTELFYNLYNPEEKEKNLEILKDMAQ